GWRPWVGVATALGFGLLTPALWQSTELFSEPGVTLGALMMVLGMLAWGDEARHGALLVGAGGATAGLFRPDSIALVLPLACALPFVVARAELRARRSLIALLAPLAAVGVFVVWYNQYRFGSAFHLGIEKQARGQGFNNPMLQGLDELLRSPAHGFFWTAP